jgi:hypothetical protein
MAAGKDRMRSKRKREKEKQINGVRDRALSLILIKWSSLQKIVGKLMQK